MTRIASTPPTGPEPPRLEVHWKLTPPHDEFRIDYADPNTGFHCGRHQDEDHDNLGGAHFEYQTASMESPEYDGVVFESGSPPKLLWECCEALFGDVIPDYSARQYGTMGEDTSPFNETLDDAFGPHKDAVNADPSTPSSCSQPPPSTYTRVVKQAL